MADVELVPYEDDLFDRFAEVFAEESLMPLRLDEPGRSDAGKAIFADECAIVRGVLDARTKEFVGYCEIKDTRKDDWEIGIAIFKRHWRKGYGYACVRALMDEVSEKYGRSEFVAKIVPDNEASVRLFQKLGATPRGVKRSIFMLNDETMFRFQREHPELVNSFVEEMALLFDVEPIELVGRTLVFDVR